MMNNKMHVNPEALLKAMKEAGPGRFPYVESTDFYLDHTETQPIDGYHKYIEEHAKDKKFPNCCIFHNSLIEYAQNSFNNFPNCCDAHKLLLTVKWFDKKNFEYLPQKLINTISFTEYHISHKIETEDWYNDITEYIEYNMVSFGQLVANYGPPVGLEPYYIALKMIIEGYSDSEVDPEKKQKLIDYFYIKSPQEKPAELPDINILVDTYKRWHKTFPFDLSYFKELKNKLSGMLPFLAEEPKINRYTKIGKAKLFSKKDLLSYLVDLTNEILRSIKSNELVAIGTIPENERQRIELINEKHKIEQTSLLNEFSKDEKRYVKIIKKWLANEKEYYKEVVPLLKPKKNEPPKPDKNLNLIDYFEDVSKYNFILNLLVKNGYCQPHTYIWNDEKKGNKGVLTAILKHLHKQGYYKKNKRLTNPQIKEIAQNTFGWSIGIDTIKKTYASDKHLLSFIPPASTIN